MIRMDLVTGIFYGGRNRRLSLGISLAFLVAVGWNNFTRNRIDLSDDLPA